MYILGINSIYHESSACLLNDGVIVATAEEERFTRKKHAKHAEVNNPQDLPLNAIEYCLNTARIAPGNIEHIGFSFNPNKRLQGSIALLNKEGFKDAVIEGAWGTPSGEKELYDHLMLIPQKLKEENFVGEFSWLDHHLCHATSTFYASGFLDAAVLTVDGIGEVQSTLLAYAKGKELIPLREILYPASLGFLWEKIAKFLGFSEYDAAKVMGLAAYGRPDIYKKHFQKLLTYLPNGEFEMDNNILRFRIEDYAPLEDLFGLPKREYGQPLQESYQDIAAALQALTEECVTRLVNILHNQTKSENLCMAGGVALNCTMNRAIYENGPFAHFYVQPASHDAGTAIGAALILWNKVVTGERKIPMQHAYLGPSFSNAQIEHVLRQKQLIYERVDEIEKVVALLLCEKNIIGWFQGRMELGPRALGNRSLLADPRDPLMRDILNKRVKHREAFRPFAPSVLHEEAEKWFEIHKPTEASEYMLVAYPVKEAVKHKIPAVVHVDGTSRIQTVRREINERYHQLLTEFFKITGVPMVLNTSFNDNEPIVCTPEDAIETFKRTRMDYLVLGDFLIDRKKNADRIVMSES